MDIPERQKMTYFETIIGACIVVAVVYLFLRHKKEMAELKMNSKERCKGLATHNFANLNHNTRCEWCNKTVLEVIIKQEMQR